MTTDEIKTLIAQTIQGQGDAVDVGGSLAKILTALADNSDGGSVEPLVVTGSIEPFGAGELYKFTPDAGQPTYTEAQAAFVSGRQVQLSGLIDDSINAILLVTGESGNTEELGLGLDAVAYIPDATTSGDTYVSYVVKWMKQ